MMRMPTTTNELLPLRVQTLGGFAVWRGDETLPESAWTRHQVAALFKLLLSSRGHCLHREQIAERLWPEVEPAVAQRRLGITLHRLRQILDGRRGDRGKQSYVRSRGELVTLAPAGDEAAPADWLDAAAFEGAAWAALRSEDLEQAQKALARYGGAYLPEDTYEEWALARRGELADLHLRLL